jgi:hypothetical protein
MSATPVVSAPSHAKAGERVSLSGAGFSPDSQVKIVVDDPKRVVVGSAYIGSDGKFQTSVVVPHAQPGQLKLQVVGTSSTGRPASLAEPVLMLTDATHPAVDNHNDDNNNRHVTEAVLIALSIAIPLATWFVLELLGWRHRRFGGGKS